MAGHWECKAASRLPHRRLLVRSGLFGLTMLKEEGYSSGIAVLPDSAVPEIIAITPMHQIEPGGKLLELLEGRRI